MVPHVCVAGSSQNVQPPVHLFFVVGLAMSVDRQERAITRAPAPNDVAAVVTSVGHDATILHRAIVTLRTGETLSSRQDTAGAKMMPMTAATTRERAHPMMQTPTARLVLL